MRHQQTEGLQVIVDCADLYCDRAIVESVNKTILLVSSLLPCTFYFQVQENFSDIPLLPPLHPAPPSLLRRYPRSAHYPLSSPYFGYSAVQIYVRDSQSIESHEPSSQGHAVMVEPDVVPSSLPPPHTALAPTKVDVEFSRVLLDNSVLGVREQDNTTSSEQDVIHPSELDVSSAV